LTDSIEEAFIEAQGIITFLVRYEKYKADCGYKEAEQQNVYWTQTHAKRSVWITAPRIAETKRAEPEVPAKT
jgi:hypothetical protein